MRFRVSSACSWSLLLFAACTDGDPVYPELPDYLRGGGGASNLGSGAQNTGASSSTGNRPSNDGATSGNGNGNGSAGKSNSGNSAGSGNTPNTDPLYGHCNLPWSGEDPAPAEPACDLDNLQDGGELTGDVSADRTLLRNHSYHLNGEVRVMAGKTLTIEPCVKVIGDDPEDLLVVMSADNLGNESCTYEGGKPVQAAKLVAAGEPNAPIVFTSGLPKGQRTPGDWGGVLLLGNAFQNDCRPGGRAATEGLVSTECYGWHTTEFNGESSGKLEYVRIEYASKQTGDGLETNGLTLAAVGSGTSIHHVMVANSNDDCFEFFGGTVNPHHLIALNCEDDMFDADKGFSGHVQFLFGRQFRSSGEADSRGFEIDTGQNVGDTTAQWSNVTICGGGPSDLQTTRNGMAFRSGAAGAMLNALVTGFAGGGLCVVGGSTPTVTYTSIFDNVNGVQSITPPSSVGPDWFTSQTGNSGEDPGRFCDCWQPKPIAVAAERVPGVAPAGFQDPDADYQGAFEDASADSNWMKGLWVDWSDN